jgi:pSer/pThr/pTyr-binding forkhead associated (FHA) protein
MNNSLEHFFSLKVTKPDGTCMTYRFNQVATVGSDPRNDIVLTGDLISAKHLLFKNSEMSFSLTFIGQDNTTLLNQAVLLKNRMYLVEKNDSIQVGKTEIIIL